MLNKTKRELLERLRTMGTRRRGKEKGHLTKPVALAKVSARDSLVLVVNTLTLNVSEGQK
jgi:hypothetical protein